MGYKYRYDWLISTMILQVEAALGSCMAGAGEDAAIDSPL